MRALAWNAWEVRRHPTDLLAVAVAAAYVALLGARIAGTDLPGAHYLVALPIAIPPLVILRREAVSPLKAHAAMAMGIALAAYVGAKEVPNHESVVYGLPAVIAAGLVAARRPALVLTVCLFCTGAFGSLQALVNVPAAKVADLMLLGLWGAAVWGWSFGGHVRSRFLPVLTALGLYVLFTAGEIFTAAGTNVGFQAFRGSVWYLAFLLLAANAPWTVASRERMLRGAALVGLVIGGYATLRWVIGPAGAELRVAQSNFNNYLNGELRPIGSFTTAKELACWTAIVAPFMFALGLSWRGRWRLLALTAAGLCVVGLLAADVRAGVAAAAPGLLFVLLLYQLSQGFRGRRGPAVLVIALAAAVVGAGAFAWTLGGKTDTRDRYESILHPTKDASYQARQRKWRQVFDDIAHAPLGHGLGTAGRTQVRFGFYRNVGSNEVDSGYLSIAYQQGFVIMVLLVAIWLVVLATLARGAITDADPARAGPMIAACGTLLAMLVIFYVGDYNEGLPALGGWVLVGLGLAQLTRRGVSDAAGANG